MRMLMNNLDPDVAENPDQLIVYGGTGRAARSWDAFDAIVRSLRTLTDEEKGKAEDAESRRVRQRQRLAEPEPPPKRLSRREEREARRALLDLPPSKRH